jgi:hypothetical protein
VEEQVVEEVEEEDLIVVEHEKNFVLMLMEKKLHFYL